MLRAVDTDVVVIAVATFHELALPELWITFGVGKNLWYVPVHNIFSHPTPLLDLTRHLHLRTGARRRRGKLGLYNEVTAVFQSLSTAPSISAVNEEMPKLERYTVLMYMIAQAHVQLWMQHVKTIQTQGKSYWCYTAYSGCPFTACKESDVPGWSLLGN
jgi:hypothetical protein